MTKFPIIIAAALAALATPAHADTYGPTIPADMPKRFTVFTDETVDQAVERYRAVKRDATRREIVFQVLNVIDTAQTIDCLHRDVCTEGNPLFGKRPSPGKLIAIKGGIGILHWIIFNHVRERDPYAARRMATWSVAIQGGIVAANARFTF